MNKQELTTKPTTMPRRLPITAFLLGTVISYVGDILTFLAIPWFVLQSTGSVIQTGITAFFSTLPAVLSAFFGTILVDRLGYKRTSVIGDIASCIAVALIPLLYSTGQLAFWQLLALVFLGGLLKSPGMTARIAMTPDLALAAQMPLERANALSDGMMRVSRFIGAPLAGILITVIGTSNLLWFDAASFALSALLIGCSVPATPALTAPKEGRYLTTLWEGVRFIRRDSLISNLLVVFLITNILDGAWSSVVQPAYVRSVFHSALPLGVLVAGFGGGAFVGTLLYSAIGHRLPRRWTLGIGFTLGGALRFWAFLLLWPIFPVLLIWQILAGVAIAPVNPMTDTILMKQLPTEMRARVFGTISAIAFAGIPFGTFISGYVVAWLGLPMTTLLIGAIYLLATLSLLVNPALNTLDTV